jgi:hypothetical protein
MGDHIALRADADDAAHGEVPQKSCRELSHAASRPQGGGRPAGQGGQTDDSGRSQGNQWLATPQPLARLLHPRAITVWIPS